MIQALSAMPRTRKTFRLDDRVVEAMNMIAKASDQTPSKWLESALFGMMQSTGYIGLDEKPLGETRGGDRKSAKAGVQKRMDKAAPLETYSPSLDSEVKANESQTPEHNALVSFVEKLTKGDVNAADIALAAHITGVNRDELQTTMNKLKNGNGHHAEI